MTLIFKKGDTEDLQNYHPINLTNVDYKILAFALAARIQNVISALINPDKIAYLQNKYIGTNITLISDVIKKGGNGLLFFLDFKTAFDSIVNE